MAAEEQACVSQEAQEASAYDHSLAERQVMEAAQQRLAAKRGELAAARRAERACEDETLKQLVLAPLPTELVRLVFLLLPADARLRCREVCRGWCAFLSDASLWRVCDLSARSGVVAERTPALLQAATERAQGTLEVLDVTGWYGLLEEEDEDDENCICLTVLLPVLHTNAESLVTLRTQDCFDHDLYRYLTTADIEALFRCCAAAAPAGVRRRLRAGHHCKYAAPAGGAAVCVRALADALLGAAGLAFRHASSSWQNCTARLALAPAAVRCGTGQRACAGRCGQSGRLAAAASEHARLPAIARLAACSDADAGQRLFEGAGHLQRQ